MYLFLIFICFFSSLEGIGDSGSWMKGILSSSSSSMIAKIMIKKVNINSYMAGFESQANYDRVNNLHWD